MSNSVNLSLDITKTGIQNPLIKVRQGDGGFETLHTTVTSNGEPLDLQGWTITFMGTTAGNHKIVDGNVNIVEAPNGIFEYTPSKAWGMDIGDFKMAYFKFVKGDGSASSANFRVSVIEAVDLTQEEAQNYISVVDTTIAKINQNLTNSLAQVTQSIADADTNANTVASKVNTLGNSVDDYNKKLAAVRVGGRNLYINSRKSLYGYSVNVQSVKVTVESFDDTTSMWHIVAGQGSGSVIGIYFWDYANGKIPNNSDWSYSADVKGTGKPTLFGVESSNIPIQGVIGSNWSRISQTGHINEPTAKTLKMYFDTTNSPLDVYIKLPKLEAGNIATDWTPAPEDAPSNDAQLVHKTGTETIAGDKTFTSPINGQLSGNAATATKWQTARTLALTGDVTGSVAVDGSGNVSMATTGSNLVHKTGAENIAGDKTFTGTVNAAQKVYTRTIGSTNDLQITYTRAGNIVTGRFVAKNTGTFPLSGNDGYKAPTNYPINVISYGINAWFTVDNKFTTLNGGEGNFMFITSDPLPTN